MNHPHLRSPLVRASLAAAALLASGCVVAAHPAGPVVMPAGQAVSIAAGYARSHGLYVDYTIAARLDRRARWHVELGGAGGRDYAMVVLDGYSGAILHARLRGPRAGVAPAPPPPPYQGPPSQGPPPPAPPPAPQGGPPPAPQGAPPPPPDPGTAPPQGPAPAPGTPGPTPAPPPG